MPIPRSDYEYTIKAGVLYIVDLDKGGMSVTNDMENVLAEIETHEGKITSQIIYRDSEGVWDEVTGWPGDIGFAPIGARTMTEALNKIIN